MRLRKIQPGSKVRLRDDLLIGARQPGDVEIRGKIYAGQDQHPDGRRVWRELRPWGGRRSMRKEPCRLPGMTTPRIRGTCGPEQAPWSRNCDAIAAWPPTANPGVFLHGVNPYSLRAPSR